MKNICVRVTCTNATQEGLRIFTRELVERQLYRMCNMYGLTDTKISTVLHNKGGVTPHVHALIECPVHISLRQVKKYLPYGFIEECRDLKGARRYLTHRGFTGKKDYYKDEDVFTITYRQPVHTEYARPLPYVQPSRG